jgi:hypothetical protein
MLSNESPNICNIIGERVVTTNLILINNTRSCQASKIEI